MPLPEQDNELATIDAEIEGLKSTDAKDVEAYATKYRHLMNKRNDTLNKLRRKHGIKVEGEGCPEPLFSFPQMIKYFNNSKSLNQTVKACDYTKPTPVQMQAMPIIKQRKDAIILAETGSGKSMAFAVPLLESIKRGSGLKAVVLAPTRELTI